MTSTETTVNGAEAIDEAVALAQRLDVERLLVREGTGTIAVEDGVARRADVLAWTDGRFLYWSESSYDADTEEHSFGRSIAATFDFDIVCDFDQWSIHHATRRQDGSYVAGANRPWDWEDESQVQGVWNGERYEVPAYAVDCVTGDSQPIEPFNGYGGEVEWWGVERVAGRVFTFTGDAEGNADFFTASGLKINGEDIVSELFYNADASRALHGVHIGGWAAAPQMSVRVRDTTSGTVIWSREFDSPVSSLSFTGDRAFVGLVPEGEDWLGYDYSTDRILVLDGSTGEVIDEVPTTLSVAYVGS